MVQNFFHLILLLIFINVSFSNKSSPSIDRLEIGVSNIQNLGNGEYLVDIYSKNSMPITGIQFDILGEDFTDSNNNKIYDLGEDFVDQNNNDLWDSELFTILEVSGGRAKKNGLEFYFGEKKGILLSFSMQGNIIEPTNLDNKDDLILLSIRVKKKIITDSNITFNINPIIAGQRGIKLESGFIPTVIE